MTRNERRDRNKEKNIECPRFKKHIQNKKSGNDDEKENNKTGHDKSKGSVSAASSNLSRNVITNIDPQTSAYVVKRKGAILNTKKSSPIPVDCLKVRATDGSGLHKDTNSQPFEAGPPPTLNSLHRLNKKVSDAKADLDKFNSNNDIVGLKLAEEKLVGSPKSNSNFRKTVSKRVDISPEEPGSQDPDEIKFQFS